MEELRGLIISVPLCITLSESPTAINAGGVEIKELIPRQIMCLGGYERLQSDGDVLTVAIYPPTFWRFSLRDQKYRNLGLA